jgi:hypothetical protein
MNCEYLAEIQRLFSQYTRPIQFGNHSHCSECADYEVLLQSYDRTNLPASLLVSGNNPIYYCSEEAYLYFFPRLCELLTDQGSHTEFEFDLFMLENRLHLFSYLQKTAVANFLTHLFLNEPQRFSDSSDQAAMERILAKLGQAESRIRMGRK